MELGESAEPKGKIATSMLALQQPATAATMEAPMHALTLQSDAPPAAADGAGVAAAASSAGSSSSAVVSSSSRLLNVNIGILGHVDSGKTSLAKALSTLLSTASLDKLPQSQERGITLDLGFSAFFIPVPEHLKARYDQVQITLVDCPGHASLIRTIIGGAGIIDLMLLVVDATKGIQTQTAECLVIGEILTERMIVVLNKTDLLLEPERQLPKIDKQLRAVFAQTKFGKDVTIVPVSANPGSVDDLKIKEGKEARGSAAATSAAAAAAGGSASSAAASSPSAPRVQPLLAALAASLQDPPSRTHNDSASPFLFAVDHCFQIKGQGTVLTGTVLSGAVRVNQSVELPHLGLERKVKSMQRFRQPVDRAAQGDRVGICVTQLDSKLVERGLLCAPHSLHSYESVVAVVDKVRFFKGACASKAKFHVSIGHATAMATVHFFGGPDQIPRGSSSAAAAGSAAAAAASSAARPASSSSAAPMATRVAPEMQFDFERDYAWRDELLPVSADVSPYTQFAVLEFEKPVLAPLQSVLLGSRLDADIHLNSCRIAFQGRLLAPIRWSDPMERARLRVVKHKVREGAIDRVVDGTTLIGRDLFSKGTDMALFVGKKVELEDGTQGVIEGAFGQGGKFKAVFPGGLPITGAGGSAGAASAPDSAAAVAAAKKSKAKVGTLKGKIYLRFKKYMYALDKKAIVQTTTTTKQSSARSAPSASASQPAVAAPSAAVAGSS